MAKDKRLESHQGTNQEPFPVQLYQSGRDMTILQTARSRLIAEELRNTSLRKAIATNFEAVEDCARRCFGEMKNFNYEFGAAVSGFRDGFDKRPLKSIPFDELVRGVEASFAEVEGMMRTPLGRIRYSMISGGYSPNVAWNTGLKIPTWEDKGSSQLVPDEDRFTNEDNAEARRRIVQLVAEETFLAVAIEDRELRRKVAETVHPANILEIIVRPAPPGSPNARFKNELFEMADQVAGGKKP